MLSVHRHRPACALYTESFSLQNPSISQTKDLFRQYTVETVSYDIALSRRSGLCRHESGFVHGQLTAACARVVE